ncbi:hypothetical protein TRAPUB_3574, partial [Trametes pubescens]
MEAMWAALPTAKHLMNVLWGGSAENAGGNDTTSLRNEFHSPSRFLETLQCNDGSPNPIIKHFRFYAACIRHLNTTSHDYPFGLLGYMKSLIGTGTGDLFPTLRQLVWVEKEKLRLHRGDMTQFFPSSQLVDITLHFETGRQTAVWAQWTPEQRTSFQDTIVHLCSAIRCGQPALRRLTIDAPIHISIPACVVIRDFSGLMHLDLRVCVGVNSDITENGRGPLLASLRVLGLLWTRKSLDAESLLMNVSFDLLQQITIRSAEIPHDGFLSYASRLMEHVSVHLTSIEIYSFTSGPTTLPKRSFHDF